MLSTSTCLCGDTEVKLNGSPVMRFVCHCSICQDVYQKPFADIIVVRSSQVSRPINSGIQFKKHRLPPAVRRGTCPSCNYPVLAFLTLTPFVEFAFIPAANFCDEAELPMPILHSFYSKRVRDVNDELPKFNGYLSSQWAVSRRLLSSLLR